jgi:hypothetical protein
LDDFEVDQTFLQIVIFVDCEPDGDRAKEIPRYFVLSDEGLIGSATMLGGCGRGEMPFYVGGPADERDVVEIDYLGILTSGL